MEAASTKSRRGVTALVHSGGGARGAQQVGVLQGPHELGLLGPEHPIEILVGSSAGSLNAGALAASVDRPAEGLALLEALWSVIEPSLVFRTDPVRSAESAAGRR